MHELVDVSVYPHQSTVLVEVLGRTSDGELVTRSYELDVDDGDEPSVRFREGVDEAAKEPIRRALEDAGYRFEWPDR